MQESSNSKQQIAEKIKQSANILVTVSSNPSVDALTAALGLTLMLNKLDKHATAVFSGVIPPAINFLEPGKTFENNVDSLRDFIIALDKDKADRLRYKVEDDVVRIFITPYRTKISQTDLQFSQGDFNVDLIIALGVEDQKDLDQAITVHGRILHDATVATINAAAQKSNLGSIDWQDAHASSLSEMLASMADSLKAGILDQQISTALLTGIVASTERFSNQKTTPHVMTISAQLMAAGANQQLIATKLQTIPAPVSPRREAPKAQAAPEASKKVSADNADDGEMHINHGEEPKEAPAPLPMEPVAVPEPIEPAPEPEPQLPIAPPAAQNFDDLKEAIQQETVQTAPQREMAEEPPIPGDHNINDSENDDEKPESDEESYLTTHPSWQGRELKPPTMGGTLSATSEQALEDKIRSENEEKRNLKILTHGGGAEAPAGQPQQQSSSSKKRKRKKSGQGGGQQDQQQRAVVQPAPAPVAPAPVAAPEPAPAPAEPAPQAVAPEPEPVTPVAEAPAPAPEPVAPAPEMPLPEPVPAPAPEPEPALPEIPIAPPPMVVAEPLTPPAESAPAPAQTPAEPAPQATHEPTLEELEREAANHAAQAVAPQTLTELEAEAHAHANKVAAPQAGPNPAPAAPAPSELGAMPMPQPLETPAPVAPAPAPAPQPEMPPTGLPPLPPMPDFSTLPPVPAGPELPQLPQQPLQQPAVPQPPQAAPQPPQAPAPTPPPAAPTDPAQFRIPGQ
ncbi:MAG TPA: hypothetical protein VJM46_01950 [Candidatus Saccharimonadales bacterium]|nr:hypothetical protein [Candidatus Saccharimonadales bacterium]